MKSNKKGFFERFAGGVEVETEKDVTTSNNNWREDENEEAELAIDLYQTPTHIVVQTMVAGVRLEDLEVGVTRDMLTIQGKREGVQNIDEKNYFIKELYWGKFSRNVLLPQEIEPEETEAVEKHGLLTIKLSKIDKERKNLVKVKSI
jgi:HSP20 family protein